MSDRCFVLGAGFSKPFGLPLANELTREVINHIERTDDFIAPRLESWLKVFKHLYPTNDFSGSWPDFEDLITVLDEWELYRAAFENTETPPDPMQPAHIKRVLLKHLGLLLCERVAACERRQLEPVERFVQMAADERLPVISFNWDLLLETAASNIEVDASYGGNISNGLQIAKPHGSLNLAEMAREDFDLARRDNNVRRVQIDYEKNGSVVARAEDPRDAANRIIHPFKETLLVEPTGRKSYESPWLSLQWSRALNMVQNADEIVVIGFSLPPTDYRPRVLLQLARLNRDPGPEVVLVDPSPDRTVERLTEFVQAPTRICQIGWTEWLDQN